jgi:hypothetical protein
MLPFLSLHALATQRGDELRPELLAVFDAMPDQRPVSLPSSNLAKQSPCPGGRRRFQRSCEGVLGRLVVGLSAVTNGQSTATSRSLTIDGSVRRLLIMENEWRVTGRKLADSALELYKRVNEVLHYVWDPIGVAYSPAARDEYQRYI